nr:MULTISPECIES: hypothetical protein [unclassified Coleofasciculus]
MCQQLGVPVKAGWKACSLALPPFAPSWESLEQIWQDRKLTFKPNKLAVNCLQEPSQPTHAVEKSSSLPEILTDEVAVV